MTRNNHNRRDFLRNLTLGVGAGIAASAMPGCFSQRQRQGISRDERKPNIIVIISDDMGYADIGVHGGKDIVTPHIDSIAQKGVRFTNGYVSCPVCSPTRAGLATGRYQQRFGHEYNTGPPPQGLQENVGLPLKEITIADVLKSAGYVTGAVGKWHLGIHPHFHPYKRGYDEFFGFLHGNHSYIDPGLATFNPILRGTQPVAEKEYLTDAFSREAVAFIEKNHEKRFFLYLAYNAVHTPLQSPERYKDKFPHITDPKRQKYAGMLTAMDEGIGKILAKLREHGLEENTLVFFVNDNGGPQANGSRNDPFRATKGTMYEGGIRVPFLVQWPKHIPAGKVYEHPVISLDILPTAAAAGQAKLPTDRVLDGVDLLPSLTGNKQTPPHEILFWRSGPKHAVRKGKWKLVRMANEDELYDVLADPQESRNLAQNYPQVLKDLQEKYTEWSVKMISPLWGSPVRARPGRTKPKPKK